MIGPYGYGERNERGHRFSHWLHGVRMTPAASLVQGAWEDTWTHQLWSTRERRQIDYFLTDSMRAETVQEAGVWRQLEGKSDHRAIYAEVECRYKASESVRKERKMRGWAPELDKDGKPTGYHELLTRHFTEATPMSWM